MFTTSTDVSIMIAAICIALYRGSQFFVVVRNEMQRHARLKEISVEEWLEENYELGISLGYPKCCVDEFCSKPPSPMYKRKFDEFDKLRIRVSKHTGFIPCKKHALQIQKGELKLEDLIKDRSDDFPTFPNAFEQEEIYGNIIPTDYPIEVRA